MCSYKNSLDLGVGSPVSEVRVTDMPRGQSNVSHGQGAISLQLVQFYFCA